MSLPTNTQWAIVTFSSPVIYSFTADESWLLNPNRRYILNTECLTSIESYIKTVSEFENSSIVCKPRYGMDLSSSKLIVERCRQRGIGDLLFLTGPLGYLQHISGNSIEIDVMAYADRGTALLNAPMISGGTVKCGPVEYDSLRNYNYHWFISSVTEQDSEPDQLNVYDALFKQLGYDYTKVPAKWKRPCAVLNSDDKSDLDALFQKVNEVYHVDARSTGYAVVAPFSNATLRCYSYINWLHIIAKLAEKLPVFVVGSAALRLPDMDISAGEFIQRIAQMRGVLNVVDATSVRVLMALIAEARVTICLDSAPLYMAQALHSPAISLWGTHPPASRIGYDEQYMRYALWSGNTVCRKSPCFAYAKYPVGCPVAKACSGCAAINDIKPSSVLDLAYTIIK
jgi:ADP-heptose:LPS heptosyltransferase